MATGAAKSNFKPTAAEGLIHVSIGAGTVNHQQRPDSVTPARRGKQVAHATEISFALFADIADENNIGCWFDLSAFQRRSNGQKGRYAGCIVADSRAVELIALFTCLQRGALRKHRIQVRADPDHGRIAVGVKKAQYIAEF